MSKKKVLSFDAVESLLDATGAAIQGAETATENAVTATGEAVTATNNANDAADNANEKANDLVGVAKSREYQDNEVPEDSRFDDESEIDNTAPGSVGVFSFQNGSGVFTKVDGGIEIAVTARTSPADGMGFIRNTSIFSNIPDGTEVTIQFKAKKVSGTGNMLVYLTSGVLSGQEVGLSSDYQDYSVTLTKQNYVADPNRFGFSFSAIDNLVVNIKNVEILTRITKIQSDVEKIVKPSNDVDSTFLRDLGQFIIGDLPIDLPIVNQFPFPNHYGALRRVNALKKGAVIRVVRDADNEIADIGLNRDGTLDTAALLDFIGNDDGRIATVYDAGGINRHAIQAVKASMPRIVINGILVTINGKPAMDFDGIDDYLRINQFIYPRDKLNVVAFVEPEITSSAGYIIGMSDTSGNKRSWFVAKNSNDILEFRIVQTGNVTPFIQVLDDAVISEQPILVAGEFDGGQSLKLYRNGSIKQQITDGVYANLNTNFVDITIGCILSNGSPASFFKGKIGEIGFWSNIYSDRQRYFDNISEHFTPDIPSEINLLLLAGQSNLEGRVLLSNGGTPSYLSNGQIEDAFVWNGTEFVQYSRNNTGPSGDGSGYINDNANGKWGPADVAIKGIIDNYGPIHICRVSQGGSILAPLARTSLPDYGSWSDDFDNIPSSQAKLLEILEQRYADMIAYCQANNITVNVIGMLWHQGEGDTQASGAAAAYSDNWTNFIAYLRQFTGISDLPVWYGTIPFESNSYDLTIRNAQLNVASADSNLHCRDNNDLTMFDNVHFDAASNIVFGEWLKDQVLMHVND